MPLTAVTLVNLQLDPGEVFNALALYKPGTEFWFVSETGHKQHRLHYHGFIKMKSCALDEIVKLRVYLKDICTLHLTFFGPCHVDKYLKDYTKYLWYNYCMKEQFSDEFFAVPEHYTSVKFQKYIHENGLYYWNPDRSYKFEPKVKE